MEAMVNVKGTIKHPVIIDNKLYSIGDALDITVTKDRLGEIRLDFLQGVVDNLQVVDERQRPETPVSEEPKATEEKEEVNEEPKPQVSKPYKKK